MTEPFAPPATTRLDLGFALRNSRTVIDRRVFRWPFVLTRTFQLDQVPAHMLTVIVQTSSGAIHGDDRLVQRLHLKPGSAAHVTTPGATAVHRANPGMCAREAVSLSIGPAAMLEYMPEPRILFPGAALDQSIDIDCAADGMTIVSDAFTLHDPAGRGEAFRHLRSTTSVRIDGGPPVMIDRLDIGSLGRTPLRAFGSMTVIAGGFEDPDRLSRDLSTVPGLYAAASAMPGKAGVGVRLAARDLRAVRAGIETVWTAMRSLIFGVPPLSRRKGY